MRLDLDNESLPLLGIAAWSGTGKTTLIEALLPRLRDAGLAVAVIKHAHHDIEVDRPGKDSHRLRMAGAAPMLVASRERLALTMETPDRAAPDLARLIDQVRPFEPDLVLIEGFKRWPLPRLELYRASLGRPMLAVGDPWVRVVASDAAVELPPGVTRLELDDIEALARYIAAWPARWPACRHPRGEVPA
ncbi:MULTISPECIES: molybdopterin-guanine dinucleotide biosynthesis protein B [unclassified Modicisalibacter]|uniref:molybdopterin-guanine dinucleotide biosynthesis protein B n=1 Tax=unclassified Modicisalibacter TaxID=2679913 RepID=UPI001CC99403|nr:MULTISPECIES: molybdopterin-guanine dinucleotide biosynthesis protein B [unclassified Modicisalibacter]MBZ9557052.1 molybdopterin-guanine dinucleotide biosynthesis protein B [Modicisalibacter sp. R2A 31.J]MBZ9574234.1 molybdopterin-guanine dinucleotide biosynthesis protein B [Modicisalibacter sp. MOD 31.J]